MVEARLEQVESGLVPAEEGWFVVNVADAGWMDAGRFGAVCRFEAEKAPFAQLGINVCVLEPGQSNGYYHVDSRQEDFLVLAGECLLLVEDQERPLQAWDFVHCAPGTGHVFVGAGEGPCVLVMVGRRGPKTLTYPVSELAARHGASVESETSSPDELYANDPETPGRPAFWDTLPWARAGGH